MPEFSMEDVDKRIEEIRTKYRQPKTTPISLIERLREVAQRRRGIGLRRGVK